MKNEGVFWFSSNSEYVPCKYINHISKIYDCFTSSLWCLDVVFVVELTKDNLLIECGVTIEANFNEYLSLLGLVNFDFFVRSEYFTIKLAGFEPALLE